MICASIGKCYAQGTEDTLFLIDRVCNKKKIAYVLDSGRLTFYDVNDSFLFIADNEGQYNLFDIANNKWKKGRDKPKKHLRLAGSKFSEFRGNTPHVGNFKSTGFSEFHIDESINYFYGHYSGDIIEMKYLTPRNSVLLNISIYDSPPWQQLWVTRSFPIKNGEFDYIGKASLFNKPKLIFESSNICKMQVNEFGNMISFISKDSILVLIELDNGINITEFHDLRVKNNLGFYIGDTLIFVDSSDQIKLISPASIRPITISSDIDFKIPMNAVFKDNELFFSLDNILYSMKLSRNNNTVIEEYYFESSILSFKISNDSKNILVHTRFGR